MHVPPQCLSSIDIKIDRVRSVVQVNCIAVRSIRLVDRSIHSMSLQYGGTDDGSLKFLGR